MDCSKTARRQLGDKCSYQRQTKFESLTLDGGEEREKHQFDIFSAPQLVAGRWFKKKQTKQTTSMNTDKSYKVVNNDNSTCTK